MSLGSPRRELVRSASSTEEKNFTTHLTHVGEWMPREVRQSASYLRGGNKGLLDLLIIQCESGLSNGELRCLEELLLFSSSDPERMLW